MIRSRTRFALGALPLLTFAALAPHDALAVARPDTLADSTWTVRWTLKNGLDVTARHIPDGNAVAVIAAYRVGRDHDPPEQGGLASLLAEVLLTAPAGDIPERSREEMSELRPRGWNVQVAARFSLVSELSSPDRFPGMLRQMATRMRGVTVTDTLIARSLRVVTRELGDRYFGSPELTLMNQVRDLAAGMSDEAIMRRAAGRGIQRVTAQEAADRLRRLYVPANAVLAVAGNLEGVDLHQLVGDLFEDIPGGTKLREPPPVPLKAATRTLLRPGLDEPFGVVGVLAPALTDSLHPNFYLNALFIGHFCEKRWGTPPRPLPGRFRYPVLADPTIVQIFPPVPPNETDADQLGVVLQDAIETMAVMVIDPTIFDDLRVTNVWTLGGPMTPTFRHRIQQNSGLLHSLASTLAMRALWGDEAFWARYRRRFMDPGVQGGDRWVEHFESPDHLVRLLLTPVKR
jgi:peptidase M16-like protein